MLPLFFPVRKFFECQVQIPVGFLTRPVTGYGAQDHTRHDEYGKYDHGCLHHMRVPLTRPSMSDTAIAEMNMPVSMYNKSI